jgi:hypothetical protein
MPATQSVGMVQAMFHCTALVDDWDNMILIAAFGVESTFSQFLVPPKSWVGSNKEGGSFAYSNGMGCMTLALYRGIQDWAFHQSQNGLF